MHFGFALELSDIDLWNTDLLDTHLGLLNPEISIQISPVSILFVSIKSLRGLQDIFKTCLQDVFKTCLQDIFKTCLQDVFKTCLLAVFKACLEDVFSVTIFRLPRRLQEFLYELLQETYSRTILDNNKAHQTSATIRVQKQPPEVFCKRRCS